MSDNNENISAIVGEVESHVQALGPLLASLNSPEIPTTIAIASFEAEKVLNDELSLRVVTLRNSVDDECIKRL